MALSLPPVLQGIDKECVTSHHPQAEVWTEKMAKYLDPELLWVQRKLLEQNLGQSLLLLHRNKALIQKHYSRYHI